MLQKAETIYHKANELVRRCGTRDTLRIAGKIGIYIHQIDTFKAELQHGLHYSSNGLWT